MQANTAAAIDSKLDGAATQSDNFTPTAAVVVPDSRRERPDRKRTMPHALSPELAQRWLAWQCRMVAGIIRGNLYLSVSGEAPSELIANWPGEGEGMEQLQQAAAMALKAGRGKVLSSQQYGPGGQRRCDLISCPLLLDGRPAAVVSAMISTRSEAQQHAVLQLLQWGGLWMESLADWQLSAQQEGGAYSVEIMAAILSHSASKAAAMEAVNRLAEIFSCERVSIGFRKGLTMRLEALSHVAGFDARTQMVRRIETAMEEALDQSNTLIYPGIPGDKSLLLRAHAELSEQKGSGSILTLPLPGRSGCVGAVTLERGSDQPFEDRTMARCESLARVIGPALELKRREERALFSRGAEGLSGSVRKLLGPSMLGLKLTILALIALIGALSAVPGTYKVTAPAGIEGAVRQILVAPQAGFIKDAQVRAGDIVRAGQLIASLDDSNLKLEAQKWQSERSKIEKEYQEALAKRDRTELSILRVRIEQVDAELELVQEKIGRTQLHAPFDGILISGDLSQSLGSPVETGQVLFEVAPLDSYRVVLEVDEHDVAGMEQGKQGNLVVTALPQSSFKINVDQVVPVAESGEGRNFFKVEASLVEHSPLLRPGMRGVAKIGIGQRDLLWIWTHELFDRIRLWLWSLGL